MDSLSEEIKRAEKAILRKEALEELLEKARKFDQLVEAQKCSTCKNVETHACRTIGCPDLVMEKLSVKP